MTFEIQFDLNGTNTNAVVEYSHLIRPFNIYVHSFTPTTDKLPTFLQMSRADDNSIHCHELIDENICGQIIKAIAAVTIRL